MVNQVIWDEGGARKVSEREEDFVQIELQVKGHESIERALDTMILGEMLEGDNAYQIEGGGKVDAQMRKCLGELPRADHPAQALRARLRDDEQHQAQLGRRLPHPPRPRAVHRMGSRRAPPRSRRGGRRSLYDLAGVLVHAGTSGFGHYFSYVKSRERGGPMNAPAGTWLTFNDRAVTGFDASQVGEQCFGGQRQIPAAGGQTQMVDKPQNGFLFYTAAEAEAPPRMQHRRSRSEPPKNLRLSPQSDHGVPSPPLSRLSPGQRALADLRLARARRRPPRGGWSPRRSPRSVAGGGAGAPVEVVSVSVAAEGPAAPRRRRRRRRARRRSGGKRSPGGARGGVRRRWPRRRTRRALAAVGGGGRRGARRATRSAGRRRRQRAARPPPAAVRRDVRRLPPPAHARAQDRAVLRARRRRRRRRPRR